MRINMKIRLRKLFFALLLVMPLVYLCIPSSIVRHYMHKMKTIGRYHRLTLEDFESNTNRSLDEINFLCMIQRVKYDNKIAIYLTKEDMEIGQKERYSCDDDINDDNNSNELFIQNDHQLVDAETRTLNETLFSILVKQDLLNPQQNATCSSCINHFYSLTLNTEKFYEKFGINENRLDCNAQLFDKLMNDDEDYQRLTTFGNERKFERIFDFTLYFDKHGYYTIRCVKRTILKISTFYFVYNLLPYDMSELMRDRQKYQKTELEKAKLINETPETIKFIENDINLTKEFQLNNKMNLLVIGFDSLSYNHFRRLFPQTYDYLNKELENAITYDSVISVGLNTYPNLLALLGAITSSYIETANVSSEIEGLRSLDDQYHDHLPLVWHDYEKYGYVTMFQEDRPGLATFNYKKKGFRYKPTGIYGRPYWIKFYETMTGPHLCHFEKPSYRYYYNLIESFLDRMNNKENINKGYFSFSFLTDYTHDDLAVPSALDKTFVRFIKKLEAKGYFDNTFLLILSDHGNRLHSYSYESEVGKVERYLPYLSIRLPKQLWGTSYAKNAKENRNKLIGFYDLYQTFRQFLHLNLNFTKSLDRKQYSINSRHTRYLRGISLFEHIPMNRSCADVLVPNEQCTCFQEKDINENEFEKETWSKFDDAFNLILKHINGLTEKVRDKCVLFKKDKINSVKYYHVYNVKFYKFVVIVQPGDAWFEADIKSGSSLKVHGDIRRLSAYGKQSICVESPILRNYCYCK